MILLLSPTKKQKRHASLEKHDALLFPKKKDVILKHLTSLNEETIQKDFKISDNLTQQTYTYFQNIDESSPAIYTYTGEAFNTLDPLSLNEKEINRLNEHLLIFSALYGFVKPLNHITLYRLDLMNRFAFNLKDYWQRDLTNYLNTLNKPILNLASGEFLAMIDLNKLTVPMINVHFQTKKGDTIRVVSSHAKKARGAYTRELIKQGFDALEDIEAEGFKFSYRKKNDLYFIKEV